MSESGTTFVWPETRGGDTAIFFCPLSPRFNATRMCGIGGVWLSFDETTCGVILGLLNTLNDSFSNVRLQNTLLLVVSILGVDFVPNSIIQSHANCCCTLSNKSFRRPLKL